MISRLSTTTGPDFDQLCANDAAQSYRKSVDNYQRTGTRSQDMDIRAFAQQRLPILQQHLATAEQLGGSK